MGILLNSEKTLKSLLKVNKDYGHSMREEHYGFYSDISKSDRITELFEGTDGRIVIDLEAKLKEESDNEYSEITSVEGVQYLEKEIQNSREEAPFYMESRIKDMVVRFFSNPLMQITKKGQIKIKGDDKDKKPKFYFDGMKINKAITQLVEGVYFSSGGSSKEKLEWIKNNMIGKTIANAIRDFSPEVKYKGKSLVLSVRPEDFFTMSCGNSWRSCMNPSGEYSSGSLPLSKGKDTIVAYLISDEDLDEDIPGGKTKIWRKLFAINDSYGVSSIAYPREDNLLTRIVGGVLFNENDYETLTTKEINNISRGSCKTDHLLPSNKEDCDYGYVDFLRNGEENAYILSKEVADSLRDENLSGYEFKAFLNSKEISTKFSFQEVSVCLECGETTTYMDDSGTSCESCSEDVPCCDSCDERFLDGQEVIVGDERTAYLCLNCVESETVFSDVYEMPVLEWRSSLAIYNLEGESTYVPSSLVERHGGDLYFSNFMASKDGESIFYKGEDGEYHLKSKGEEVDGTWMSKEKAKELRSIEISTSEAENFDRNFFSTVSSKVSLDGFCVFAE